MYHLPVLLEESVNALVGNPNGLYLDVTFGGGGHSRHMLNKLEAKAAVIGFDQDDDASGNLSDDERFAFVPSNFRYLKEWLDYLQTGPVDGILADLGVSSHQFDELSRGFSYKGEAELDMRMNQSSEFSAVELVNNYREEELVRVFSKYGEVRNSKELAAEIVKRRQNTRLRTINDLLAVIERVIRGKKMRYLSQVFQAIRIEVNDEINALEDFLKACVESVKPGGKLVVISYHSLEDRLVKNFLKAGNAGGKYEKDPKGNIIKPFKEDKSGPFVPSDKEIKNNSRARSAKMRVAVKNEEK